MEPKTQFHREILEQPQALSRLLREGRKNVEEVASKIRQFSPEWVLIAARGSSDNAARYAQYLLGVHNRLGVALAVPSLFTLYGTPPSMKRALVIGISQSGQSPDIVSVLEEARKQGGATIAVTNDADSPLARASEHTIPLLAGEERAVAATKTYTTELMALAMLSAALEGEPSRWAELEAVPDAVSGAIALNTDLEAHAKRFLGTQKLVVIGRGFNYSSAFETALKIKETSYLVAEPYSVADLLHGPVAMIDAGFPVIVVAPSGKGFADVPALLDLLEKREAKIVAISDNQDVLKRASTPLALPPGIPEWLSPIAAIVPGQLWAYALASAAGHNPDAPRGLSKVTMTR
jgi:glucosamine--fructose-6-phosphate aminotransferase (isomerizing)